LAPAETLMLTPAPVPAPAYNANSGRSPLRLHDHLWTAYNTNVSCAVTKQKKDEMLPKLLAEMSTDQDWIGLD